MDAPQKPRKRGRKPKAQSEAVKPITPKVAARRSESKASPKVWKPKIPSRTAHRKLVNQTEVLTQGGPTTRSRQIRLLALDSASPTITVEATRPPNKGGVKSTTPVGMSKKGRRRGRPASAPVQTKAGAEITEVELARLPVRKPVTVPYRPELRTSARLAAKHVVTLT